MAPTQKMLESRLIRFSDRRVVIVDQRSHIAPGPASIGLRGDRSHVYLCLLRLETRCINPLTLLSSLQLLDFISQSIADFPHLVALFGRDRRNAKGRKR